MRSVLCHYRAQFDLVDVKMKIKYGTKKAQPQPPLASLRQNDQICEAVLDTFSEDYLNYISHLVKKASSPPKAKPPTPKQPEFKARRYSETSAQLYHPPTPHGQLPLHPEPERDNDDSHRPITNQRPESPLLRKEKCKSQGGVKKKKVQYNHNDSAFKNQKTMLVTKHSSLHAHPKTRQDTKPELPVHKPKKLLKTTQKYYTTIEHEQESESEGTPSIEEPFRSEKRGNRHSQATFISNIDNYLLTLQERQSIPQATEQRGLFGNTRESTNRNSRSRPHQAHRHKYTLQDEEEEEAGVSMREVMKENVKLRKKVKLYEQRIEDLDDEISGHLVKCKERDRHQKSKINELIIALNQAIAKKNQQKGQIDDLKGLLKHFGQQVRQMETRQEDSEEDDLAESLMQQVLPQSQHRHSQLRPSKQQRLLEATMPKHEEERRLW